MQSAAEDFLNVVYEVVKKRSLTIFLSFAFGHLYQFSQQTRLLVQVHYTSVSA